MNEQTLRYALAKQVPDMERGFTVATSYGDIVIEPGWLADRIQAHMRRVLEAELLAQAPGAASSAAQDAYPWRITAPKDRA